MDDVEQISTGDFVFVHLRDDLDIQDGPIMRAGIVKRIGTDFFDALMIELDDGNPPFYLDHARAISNHGQSALAG